MAKFDNPEDIRIIVATDCGSTTTKAILIQYIDGEYRLTTRGEAPTTVEAPFEDVTMGVLNAVAEVEELSGRKLLDDNGRFITPAQGDVGTDIYISTSSAGGGLQMMVAGVVRSMTAESAERAALGAGAIVMDVIASNDKRLPHQQIERIRHLRPDMILLSGGIDGGTTTHVVELAELISAADPRPRLGSSYKLPVIYAGNKDARDAIADTLAAEVDLKTVDNLRPVLERENLGPAREEIHELFMEHVMAQAPGYKKLMSWCDAPIMPTPGAVGLIIKTIADQYGIEAVGVDIGGATTDVFSVFRPEGGDGVFNRTVSANLGMSYSISNVFAEATLPMVMRWVPFRMDERDLRNRVKNKMIRPTTIPQSMEELIFEQAIAKEALRLAFIQHKNFATVLKGVQQQRTIADAFEQTGSGKTIVNMMTLNMLIGSGGVLSHAPRRQQAALMLIDAFLPEGVTRLAVDSIFMMPQLGVLTEVQPKAATEVFEKDCLIHLGTCVAPAGTFKKPGPVMKYRISLPTGEVSGVLSTLEMKKFELGVGPDGLPLKARAVLEPERGFDVGAGKGNKLETDLSGGVVGIILDGRGRPFDLSELIEDERVSNLKKWMIELDIYPADKL
ncbi:MAG TPA: glutamate mutase L [candidate division Zixibacteria bacterium]|nr:glutamate mutase L [candidate division Zixibacteria bacterium]MDD4918523.1 glutamate mutase L [candidate division Zixibacteria bacterium]MDM7973393.1 glutamate mutase L [candidate division Zixibacteria bacterium]HPM37134.1 glutamate mutase L [candidate division Zixibacteria bacterium]HQL24190.1 glutamate mutase L [candidate division Zixibacteria bacterium]